MRISDFLKKNTRVEAELLLANVLKKPKEFLYLHPEHKLTILQYGTVMQYVKRREKGEPAAYILGFKDFMGRRFKVNKDVLIPRPETEGLVEKVLSVIPSESSSRGIPLRFNLKGSLRSPSDALRVGRDDKMRLLDVGTGSGCVIISLAKILKANSYKLKPVFYASDISKKALKVARANAKAHGVKVKFIHSDILQNIRISFDVIVANLPYVPKKDYRLLKKGLRYEPKGALVDPVKDFDVYRRFFQQVSNHLNPGGVVLLEIDPSSKKILKQYQEKYLPKTKIKFYKDFNSLWRYAEIGI